MKKPIVVLAMMLILQVVSGFAMTEPKVVATIKPIHSLVEGVMGDAGSATLIVSGYASPHGYQLKPSQVKSMKEADIIFYVGDTFETFLLRSFRSLPENVKRIPLSQSENISFYKTRSGGAWESHEDHDHGDHHGHDHGDHEDHQQNDMHIWLDIDNAKYMVRNIQQELSNLYPQHAETFAKNSEKLIKKLTEKDAALRESLTNIKGRPFVVFHDAYQYFERRYSLKAVGSISFDPSESPSATRIQEVRKKITEEGAVCVYREPQFSDKLIKTVTEGTTTKFGTLDPIGANIKPGSTLYFELLDALQNNLISCLK